jgi:outer membrane murein-binding lipoprotein Lpp
LRILLATHQLSWIGGADTYTVTVAEHLQRLGHDVTVFAAELGEMAEVARGSGLVVTADERALPAQPDVVYAQDGYVSLLLAERFPSTPQAMAIHADEYDLWLPPQLPGVTAAVVALHGRVAKRARAAAVVPEVVRLTQPVDTERFSPRGPLHDPPRSALLLGNYLAGDQLGVVAQACDEAGIAWEQVGYKSGGPTREPERLMGDADIVIGKARVIVEAMASGRAAYVYDHNGGDGWVTPERYALLEADNFGGQAEPVAADLARLRSDLKRYRPDMGAANRQLAVANHSANKHAQDLALLFQRLSPRAQPVNGPLRELARLVRVQTDIDRRAHALAVEAREAREREQGVRVELAAAQARLAELDAQVQALQARVGELDEAARGALERERSLLSQRRVRLGLALARPLDRARRLFR